MVRLFELLEIKAKIIQFKSNIINSHLLTLYLRKKDK